MVFIWFHWVVFLLLFFWVNWICLQRTRQLVRNGKSIQIKTIKHDKDIPTIVGVFSISTGFSHPIHIQIMLVSLEINDYMRNKKHKISKVFTERHFHLNSVHQRLSLLLWMIKSLSVSGFRRKKMLQTRLKFKLIRKEIMEMYSLRQLTMWWK